MKILHTGDLHIGKYVHEFSMLEDQRYILKQMLELAVREKVEVMLIAGDVYDRAVPTAEAVTVLDDFLTRVLAAGIRILMISGNHDSPERVGFASRILEKQGLYITGAYEGSGRKVTLEDSFGEVTFLCIPYYKPGTLGAGSSQEAVAQLLAEAETDFSGRNVLLTHYFITDGGRTPLLSDSETMVHVGGLDNVDVRLLEGFDYVALGHIHRPQQIGEKMVCYAGSPLKYSFSEAAYDKSVSLITLGEKGDIRVTKEKLTPRHELRRLRGSLEELLQAAEGGNEDYIQVTLTDEEEPYNPIGRLRTVYPNVMQLVLAKNEPVQEAETDSAAAAAGRSPLELYGAFYQQVRGSDMDEARQRIIEEVMKEAEEE